MGGEWRGVRHLKYSLDGFADTEQPLAVIEDVFDGSPDRAEDLHDQIGLVTGEALDSTFDCQLLLGIVVEGFGGRVDLDILDDIEDDRQSGVDLGLIQGLARNLKYDPDDQGGDKP